MQKSKMKADTIKTNIPTTDIEVKYKYKTIMKKLIKKSLKSHFSIKISIV